MTPDIKFLIPGIKRVRPPWLEARSRQALQGLNDLAVAKEADRQAFAARSGFDPKVLEDQNNRVPFSKYMALIRTAKELSHDPLSLCISATR